MAAEVEERLMSAETYLEWESAQPFRNELIDNSIYPMTGGSPSHNLINFDLAFALTRRLENRGCEIFGMEIQVQVNPTSTYTYPDVVVVCGEADFRVDVSPARLMSPTLIFETLSPSTEKLDRTRKMEQYLRIPSLQGYFLVAQDQPLIDAHTRAGDNWLHSEAAGLESSLIIPSLDCEIPLSEIYRRVRFEETQ